MLFILLLLPSVVTASDIFIDIGHSPKSSGAISCSGKSEHEFNKRLAQSIHRHLDGKNVKAELLASDENMTFAERVRQSNGSRFLLSIHHDSVQPQFVKKNPIVAGNCSDYAEGFSIFISANNPAYKESLQYATALGKALISHGLKPSIHHAEKIKGEFRKLISDTLGIYEFSNLRILKNTAIPSVLFEAAVIVNPNDEQRASSPDFHRMISDSVHQMLNVP